MKEFKDDISTTDHIYSINLDDKCTDAIVNFPILTEYCTPIYVNAKQFQAIFRRRLKKLMKYGTVNTSQYRYKKKYTKRSNHAKKRVRSSDGKFEKQINIEKSPEKTQ